MIDWNLSPEFLNESRRQRKERYDDIVVPEEVLNRYYAGFSEIQKKQLYHVNITPDNFPLAKQKQMWKTLSGIANWEEKYNEWDTIVNRAHKTPNGLPSEKIYNFLGVGKSGIVILKKWILRGYKNNKYEEQVLDFSVHKFSDAVEHEYELLKMLKKPKNVVVVKSKGYNDTQLSDDEPPDYLELEPIIGDSLDNLVNTQGSLSSKATIKYFSDILNGLIEMRNAGIWHHRDIRPANIMIDSIKDRAVIIDLGIAITDKNAITKDNRRYGGRHDLNSLGLVAYKMVTGKHLLADSRIMEETIYAGKIKENIDKMFSNYKVLEQYLKKVDSTVNDKIVKKLITTCLTADKDDHEKIMKMLK